MSNSEASPESNAPVPPSSPDVRPAVEISIRLGVLLLLTIACLMILAPFVGIVVWAAIIAVAADELCTWVARRIGDRRTLAATLMTIFALSLLIVPAVVLSDTLIGGAHHFADDVRAGNVTVPPPPDSVADWPIVGDRIFETWQLASQNLSTALERAQPQLEAVSRWLLAAAGSTGVALLQLAASLILAGVLLARSDGRRAAITKFATRLAGERGPEFAELAGATVRSVVQGILGVAVIQTMLAALGFMVAGVPFAGLWALLVLVAAIVQLPVALVMLPPILLAAPELETVFAIVFVVWCIAVALLDNVLKPILFGRGVNTPTIVIFLGAIGGMIAMGIVGLFLGAVVLALGYELFVAWLDEGASPAPTP